MSDGKDHFLNGLSGDECGIEDDSSILRLKLSEGLDMRDICSETGTVFEVSSEELQERESTDDMMKNFFSDESLLNSLSLGAGNAIFDDNDEEESSSGDDCEPFEKLSRKMEDMIGDSGVMKMIVRPGIGGDIPEGSIVTFHYNGYLQYNDEPFDSTHFRNKPEKKRLNDGVLLQGLEVAIKSMRKKETSRFLIKPRYAYGELGCPPRIPGNETLLYEVTVVNFVDHAAADAYENLDEYQQQTATFKEKLEAARGFHRKGNSHYQEGNFFGAKDAYFRAAWIMEDSKLKNEEEEQQRCILLMKLRSNLAQVFLNLKEPARACTQCKLGLGVAGNQSEELRVKLIFRIGKAKALLNDFKGARKEFLRAQRLKPSSYEVGCELEALLHKEQKYEAQERFMCRRMFQYPQEVAVVDGQSEGDKEKKNGDDEDHKSILAGVRPEFERIVDKSILNFVQDANVTELPFPCNLSQGEIAYIRAKAKLANCYVTVKNKGVDTYLKVHKKNSS